MLVVSYLLLPELGITAVGVAAFASEALAAAVVLTTKLREPVFGGRAEVALPPPVVPVRDAPSAGLSLDIIVNNHNYCAYVGAAIESALTQAHDVRSRVIVVDDGSTDDSRRVIESYGDRIVPVLKECGGQGSAFNAGVAQSFADVVIFLDADDTLAPGCGRRAVEAFEAEPALSRVQYRMEVIDETGERTGVIKPPPHLPMAHGDVRRQELAFPFDLTWMATSGNAFAGWALRRLLPMPEHEFRLGADWYVVHLASLLGLVASLEKIGGYYRVHGANRYELSHASLDLRQVRQTVTYAMLVRAHIERLARELELLNEEPSLSVSDLAHRLVSLKLDPGAHPLDGDTVRGVLSDGMRAALRRFDVRWPMRVLFVLWFAAVAIAPRPLVAPLAQVFLFPERRPRLSRLLGAMHVRD
jgi:glycosyltransferase involved in cell wall biosynthesis